MSIIKETNFQMIRKLNEEYDNLSHDGVFISEETAALIKKTLHLSEMTVLELRNLRDFTVAFYYRQEDNADYQKSMMITDKISAITHMIDIELFNKGAEV